jgi:AcrR family transcriptional regulator
MAKHHTNQTAQNIILAALECLERDGLEGMTIRTIAQQAQVNIAAVNYHFGSKEALLTHVLEFASRNAFLDFDQWVSADSGKALEQQLEAFANHLIDGLVGYPNTSRVVLHELMFGQHPTLKNRFEEFLGKLVRHTQRLHGQEGAWRSAQFVQAMIGLCLLPDAFEGIADISLKHKQTRQTMLALLL